jgi:hypothetical protein
MLRELVRAALRSGLQHVHVAAGPAGPDAGLAPLLRGVDVVLQALAPHEVGAARVVASHCAAAGTALTQIVLADDEAWLVPVRPAAEPGVLDTGWSAAQARSVAAPSVDAGPRPAAASVEARPVVATAVANHAMHGVFRWLTGMEPAVSRTRVTRISTDSLRSHVHTVLPHPFAAHAVAYGAAGFRHRITELEQGAPLDEEEVSRRLAPAVDDRFGILALTEYDWAQSPLNVSAAVAADPVGLLGPGARPDPVVGAGFGAVRARCAAALRALARYAAVMVDPRRLVDAGGTALVDDRNALAGEPVAALAAVRTGALTGQVWGHVIGATTARTVPAHAAFPVLRACDGDTPYSAGLAAAYDWSTAIRTGLIGQCRRRTLIEAGTRRTPYPRVRPDAVPLDRAGAICLELLTDLGDVPQVYDVTGSLGVPTFAFCLGARTIAYTTAFLAADAISDGLLRVVQAAQARIFDQPGYAPAAVPELPMALRGEAVEAYPPGVDNAAVVAGLRRNGRVAVAVPLDHDPALVELLPYLVNVVIDDA